MEACPGKDPVQLWTILKKDFCVMMRAMKSKVGEFRGQYTSSSRDSIRH